MRNKQPKFTLLPEKQRAFIFHQLEQMDRAGIDPDRMFTILQTQTPADIAKRAAFIQTRLRGGGRIDLSGFSAGLFSDFDRDCIMIAGETGRYDQIYAHLSEYYTKRVSNRRKIKSQMVYPVVVLILAVFIQPIPALVAGLLTPVGYVQQTVGFLFGLIALAWVILNSGRWIRQGALGGFAQMLDTAQVELPGVSVWYARRVLRDFFAHLSLMLAAGAPLFNAWPKACQLLHNSVYKRASNRVGQALEAGEPFADALDKMPMIDPVLRQFIYSGEHAGALDTMIDHFVRIESEQIELSDQFIADWIPRILYGLVVAWIVSGLF